ncbi:MAG: S-layer homology domain-containing protein [Chloroflexia bacterium]
MYQTRTRQKQGRATVAPILALVVMALAVFSIALTATRAGAAPLSAAPKGGDTITPTVGEATATATPAATPTRRPIKLRPRVQFGHAPHDENVRYRLLLFNNVSEETNVNMTADSLFDWRVAITPTVAVALPNYANEIGALVHVPEHPFLPIDVERVRGTTDTANPYTTTAFLITVTRRHHWADVGEDHWADGPVQYLYDKGVISGYGDGSFRPNETVTRAQFAKMLVGAMEWELVMPQTPTFSDVPADSWAYSYIETAYAHGVISGYADSTFRPGAPVTRAQVAKMVYISRAWSLDAGAETVNFNDVQQGDWYYTYAMAAGASEIMAGYEDHTFRPNAPATRGQVAKILTIALFSDPNF